MNISSNTLFHFTDEMETIKSILSDKFYGSYCKETLRFDNENNVMYVPMISFCDIPLKIISEHTKYGKFGIGMSKKWGIKNGLNPVLYHEKNSSLSKSIIEAFVGGIEVLNYIENEIHRIGIVIDKFEEDFENNMKNTEKLDALLIQIPRQRKFQNVILHLRYSMLFTKHYSDDLDRNGEITKDYPFYDEREWRYVPGSKSAVLNKIINETDYIEWRGQEIKKPILENVNLSFKSEDVEYIIVKENTHIKEIRDYIKQLPITNFNQEEKEDLFSKIISFEKIVNM